MKISNIENRIEERIVSFAVQKDRQGYFCCADRNGDGTVSLFFVKKADGGGYAKEAAVFGKNGVEALNEKFTAGQFRAWMTDPRVRHRNEDALKALYGERMTVGFNSRKASGFQSAYALVEDFISMHGDFPEYNDALPDYSELDSEAIQRLGRLNTELNAAYIQKAGSDKSVVRIFCGKGGKVAEHSRIVTIGDKSMFCWMANGRFRPDRNPDIDSFDFAVAGLDDIGGMHVSHVYRADDSVGMCLSLMSGGFENIVKMDFPKIYEMITEDCEYGMSQERLAELFGGIDPDAKSFHMMIGIPQKLLEFIENGKIGFDGIRRCKAVFGENLTKMKPELITDMADALRRASGRFDLEETNPNILQMLSSMFGEEHMEKYVRYLSGDDIGNNRSLYSDYVSMLYDYSLHNAGFGWKLRKDRLQAEHDRAAEAMNMIADKETKDAYGDAFAARHDEWMRYEYKGKDLSVKAPDGVEELIREGQVLKHCVRDYAESMADGKSIVMFIRKNADLESPCYTMEIKNGRIIQCRGMCNRDPSPAVLDFLNEYCKAKKLSFDRDYNA